MKNILIIGGGAAGMMAAVWAAHPGCKVSLFEKNEKPGRKIYITGKGRCNFTNACETEKWMENICSGQKFMYSSFHAFTNRDVIRFFEDHGMPVKIERGQRAFPVSDHASDVTAVLVQEMKRRGVHVCLNSEVKELLTEKIPDESDTDAVREDYSDCAMRSVDETATGKQPVEKNGGEKPRGSRKASRRITGVRLADGTEIRADAVIVCTGGLSYPSTGSTGDGFRFARETGHRVTECTPSLVPLNSDDEDVRSMQGLSLRNVRMWIRDKKKTLFDEFGEMMFTHFGITGPLVLTASTKIQKELARNPLTVHIDLKPAITQKQLDERFLREFAAAKNRQFKNVLGAVYPSKMIPVIISRSGIPETVEVNSITKEQRRKLCEITKDFTLTVTSLRGYSEAIITRGGVDLRQIDPSTMESKLVRGLYFAGEVLNVDAVTGGFNLQIAWSTGAAAGRAAGGTE